MRWKHVLRHPCPKCAAPKGKRCLSLDGEKNRKRHHIERLKYARTQVATVEADYPHTKSAD